VFELFLQVLFWYSRIVSLSLWGWTLFLDLVAGAVWWILFGSFFYSCFEEQWLIFMNDFCRFVALLQVKLSFNLSLLLWSRPRLRSSRALCLSLALIFINSEVWRRSLMNGNLLLLLWLINLFCRALICSSFILTSWSVLWGIPFPSWKDVLGTPKMYQAMRGLWTSAFVCRGF